MADRLGEGHMLTESLWIAPLGSGEGVEAGRSGLATWPGSGRW